MPTVTRSTRACSNRRRMEGLRWLTAAITAFVSRQIIPRRWLAASALLAAQGAPLAKNLRRLVCRSRQRLPRHPRGRARRSEEHTSELQSHSDLVCRLLLEKKNHRRLERAIH